MTDNPKSQTSGAFTKRVDLWDTVLRRFRTAEHLEHDQKTEGLLKSLARLGAMVVDRRELLDDTRGSLGPCEQDDALEELVDVAERIRKEYGGG